jgi:methyltransferase (TIGR00027 family)
VIRDVSDTAFLTAAHRASETERPDAAFRDPFARRLAGARGAEVAGVIDARHGWAFTARTWLVDRIVAQEVRRGADMVVNLAAGLDARPYRLDLPASLRWIEVDLPAMLAYKAPLLEGERPRCALERVPLDLADRDARVRLFEDLGRRAKDALVLAEGFLFYLTEEKAAALARDLAAAPGFRRWAFDLASPGLVQILRRKIGRQLGEAMAFGPAAGPAFFEPHGWKPLEVHSRLKAAARLKRLPLLLRLLALLPESQGRQGRRPWSGVCLLERA